MTQSDAVRRLVKRKTFLEKRLRDHPDKNLTFDLCEVHALDFAIAKIIDGSKRLAECASQEEEKKGSQS